MQSHKQSLALQDSSESATTQSSDAMFAHQNNLFIPDGVHNVNSDYITEHESRKFQHQQHKLDAFSNNFRMNNFSEFPAARTRHQTRPGIPASNSFRDPPSFFPSGNTDVFSSTVTSPAQPHIQAFESRTSYDYSTQFNANALATKSSYIDLSSNLHRSQQVNGHKVPHQQQIPQHSAYPTYSSGLHLSSQTPYGPHVAAPPSSSSVINGATSATSGGPPGLTTTSNTSTSNGPLTNNEEISTIFVVGFPDDMQEREFQNMFTFSPDFEAATLKIPNKEYTSYGGVSNGTPGLRNGYPPQFNGPNDPYNLVTVNQGGIMVDGGRDGTMTSWPATVSEDMSGMPFVGGNVPGMGMQPRKQIIGFAKFRTRDAALQARDGLQGRRVDIDKGAVLKAEMAKKNLHTKRGVGPVSSGVPSGHPAVVPGLQQALANGGILGANGEYGVTNDTMGPRERELGALGAMGLGNGRLSQWRDQSQHDHIHPTGQNDVFPGDREDEDRWSAMNPTALNTFGTVTRGPRERAGEDDRERRRKEGANVIRVRPGNINVYEAFHSAPSTNTPPSRHAGNQNTGAILSSTEPEVSMGTSPLATNGFTGSRQTEEMAGPWDNIKSRGVPVPHSISRRSSSPPLQSNNHTPLDVHPRSFSPDQYSYPDHRQESQHVITRNHSCSESSSSSVVGGPVGLGGSGDAQGAEADFPRSFGGLDLNAEGGKTSPQLPSPSSGASSRNGVDQNPPINTLYVGNLPTSPPQNGFPQDYLEESLRELFSTRAGFRRLCFRQKSNGPMCFVEFEDVPHATKALHELYGNNLKGLIKGGIRLSYSKNPLGVRTPTSAGGNSSSLQQQQQQQLHNVNGLPINSSFPTSTAGQEFQRNEEQLSRAPPMILRRDMTVTSPQMSNAHSSFAPDLLASSPPPPRFSSPSGFASSTLLTGTSNPFTSRYAFGLPSSQSHGQPSPAFSPFGMSNTPPPHSIPDHQITSDTPISSSHSQHFHNFAHPNNLEAARAA